MPVKYIVGDVLCVIKHAKTIVKAKGVIVPGLGDRTGRRHHKSRQKRGGAGYRKLGKKNFKQAFKGWMHPDAEAASKDAIVKIVEENYLNSIHKG